MPKKNRSKKNGRKSNARPKLQRDVAASNTAIIPLISSYDTDLTTDVSKGFGFTTAALWVNGVSVQAISGAAEVAAVFDLMRIVKVEITMIPGYNTLEITNSTAGGINALPYLYHAFDPNDSTNPSLTEMEGNSTTMISDFTSVHRRTIHPNLLINTAIADLSRTRSNEFVKSGDNSHQYVGFKVFADLVASTYQYAKCRFVFKIFYECTSSK